MSNRAVWIGGGVIVLLAAGVAVLFSLGEGTEEGTDLSTIPQPLVSGVPLSLYVPDAPDGSIGQAAPEAAGTDFELNQVGITNDGRPKVVLFLAHWCPHCQVEVPQVQQWLDAGGKPEGVDFYSVATSIDELRPNYPPDAWLQGEGWTAPVLVDTNNSVSNAYGLSFFPYWVFLNADGTVFGRVTGGLPPDQLTDLFELLLP